MKILYLIVNIQYFSTSDNDNWERLEAALCGERNMNRKKYS